MGVGYVRLGLNVPGRSTRAYVTLPARIALCLWRFVKQYPSLLYDALKHAIQKRLSDGLPSLILCKGGAPLRNHQADGIYMASAVHDQPFDEPRLRAAFESLAADSPGLGVDKVELVFEEDKPAAEWPTGGSWQPHVLNPTFPQNSNMYEYWGRIGNPSGYFRRLRVFNGLPGKPTVVHYQGSVFPYDGSSDFNWYKEVMSRYAGHPPKDVLQEPPIDPASAAKFDAASFALFLLKLPWNAGRALWSREWSRIRAEPWAGGNGLGAKLTAMNFTKEESARLYRGSKRLGGSPFSAFTHATHKACVAVLGHGFTTIAQQASLQTKHFPCAGQEGKRDLVGDWLFAPVQRVPVWSAYDLAAAERGYQAFLDDLAAVGPRTRNTFMAKAYGQFNGGAACFETLPSYNDCAHLMDRCLFFNNYGVRKVDEAAHLTHWLWNAPLWLGVNTININGATTTLVGSSFMGLEVVEAIRDHIEATLREIMEADATPGASGDGSA